MNQHLCLFEHAAIYIDRLFWLETKLVVRMEVVHVKY